MTPGDTIRFRWRFSSDPGAEYAGFYLDDLAVTNVRLMRNRIHDADRELRSLKEQLRELGVNVD